ncbi:hypothetical protein Q757_03445 [Oenococcus alcoholitolerans]|uniref:Uncharacterized protein n=1 Tax=Oenococcus alcoholitolerans TaxID=931074 RepID=A0ABR4XRC3_9LACO|nr:hypothetical protein Q757_03445 [Oenococcus alcoholitolerans]
MNTKKIALGTLGMILVASLTSFIIPNKDSIAKSNNKTQITFGLRQIQHKLNIGKKWQLILRKKTVTLK